jgi:hypothetical protein
MEIIHYINKLKQKDLATVSINAEKAFGEIQHLFMTKLPRKIRMRAPSSIS